MQTAFSVLDAAIIVAYLAVLTGVGLYFSRRQRSLDEYFLARRSMTWLPVGLSLMAALDSAIDYLMQPSSTIKYGLVLLIGTSSWLFLYPWVAHVTLPFYRRLNYYTAYEYLEARFDVRVRSLAAGIFIIWRLGWMATAIYVPCLAITAATGGRIPLGPTVFVLGCVVTLYTALGGVQAVIWNDVIQFCVRFGGLTAVVAIAAASVPGGLTEIWRVADTAGKTTMIAPIAGSSGGVLAHVQAFFEQPLNIVAIMCSLVFGRMAAYVGDQIMVQRLQTTKSLADARKAFIVNAAGDIIWMFALSFVGLALFAYFQLHALPADFSTDKILPYFMSLTFPRGIVGLVTSTSVCGCGGRPATSAPASSSGTRSWCRASRRLLSAPPAPCWPSTCRASAACSRLPTSWSTPSPVRSSAFICWRCSAGAPPPRRRSSPASLDR
jgi:Na+/proline symporter